MGLTRDLCRFRTGVLTEENAALFERLSKELPIEIHRYPSGSEHLGWQVPQSWKVKRALVRKGGRILFDGKSHTLGVAYYSRSFQGELSLKELMKHVVTDPKNPTAYMFHCQWQYRPWNADWALSIPHRIIRSWKPGKYEVDLETEYSKGEMLVAEANHRGEVPETIVFHSNTCHPHMANDGFAGTAVMIRLFQWLKDQPTRYSYRLLMCPEHIGTVFYLSQMSPKRLNQIVAGVFGEMMGTQGSFTLASSFLGNQLIDRAFRVTLRHYCANYRTVEWRRSVGNDETVWESPGYEVPFVQVNRAEVGYPYREYHTSLDTPDLMDPGKLLEFYDVFQRVIFVLENNIVMKRKFRGIVCLSNPKYNLYHERMDPAVRRQVTEDGEKWGYLNDCILRYFDGRTSLLDVAEKHDLPFDSLFHYVKKFEEKGLISTTPLLLRTRSVN